MSDWTDDLDDAGLAEIAEAFDEDNPDDKWDGPRIVVCVDNVVPLRVRVWANTRPYVRADERVFTDRVEAFTYTQLMAVMHNFVVDAGDQSDMWFLNKYEDWLDTQAQESDP